MIQSAYHILLRFAKYNMLGHNLLMSQFFNIHETHPQMRLLRQAVGLIKSGSVIIYPTDCGYSLGCQIGNKKALERLRRIRQLDAKHPLTLLCPDLSSLAKYAKVDNITFRLLKAHTPGPFTFILRATPEVPKRLIMPGRKTIGIRIPANVITQSLLSALGEPILSTTMKLPGYSVPMIEPGAMRERIGNQVDLIIDGGYCGVDPTTVVDLTDGPAKIVRQGCGTFVP